MALPHVDVIMAIYRPDMARLVEQVESILDQQGVTARLFLFADGPMPDLDAIRHRWAGQPRVRLIALPENRGPAATFVEGIAHVLALPDADRVYGYLAFADQDDIWDGDKLAVTVAALEREAASAAHSDARLVDGEGRLIAPSIFETERRDRACTTEALFFRNVATGMTMVFDRETAVLALSLRDARPSLWLHDHFIAMIAMARNGLAFVDRPLVSYVQHGNNVVGAYRLSGTAEIIKNVVRHVLKSQVWSRDYLRQGRNFVAALLDVASPHLPGYPGLAGLSRLLEGRGLRAVSQALVILASHGPADLVGLQLLLDKLGDPRTRGTP